MPPLSSWLSWGFFLMTFAAEGRTWKKMAVIPFPFFQGDFSSFCFFFFLLFFVFFLIVLSWGLSFFYIFLTPLSS